LFELEVVESEKLRVWRSGSVKKVWKKLIMFGLGVVIVDV